MPPDFHHHGHHRMIPPLSKRPRRGGPGGPREPRTVTAGRPRAPASAAQGRRRRFPVRGAGVEQRVLERRLSLVAAAFHRRHVRGPGEHEAARGAAVGQRCHEFYKPFLLGREVQQRRALVPVPEVERVGGLSQADAAAALAFSPRRRRRRGGGGSNKMHHVSALFGHLLLIAERQVTCHIDVLGRQPVRVPSRGQTKEDLIGAGPYVALHGLG
ncbi:uncharacterized protein PG998_001647 [Apiospora kogelbergensis]|uniref:uncharacterized protein n=1 Tax=Apiospora kogelbergensis TaxID=1337665 RepID=UPI00312FADBE